MALSSSAFSSHDRTSALSHFLASLDSSVLKSTSVASSSRIVAIASCLETGELEKFVIRSLQTADYSFAIDMKYEYEVRYSRVYAALSDRSPQKNQNLIRR